MATPDELKNYPYYTKREDHRGDMERSFVRGLGSHYEQMYRRIQEQDPATEDGHTLLFAPFENWGSEVRVVGIEMLERDSYGDAVIQVTFSVLSRSSVDRNFCFLEETREVTKSESGGPDFYWVKSPNSLPYYVVWLPKENEGSEDSDRTFGVIFPITVGHINGNLLRALDDEYEKGNGPKLVSF